MTEDCCVLIPAYCPSERMVSYIEELCSNGIGDILVVNDGSGASYEKIFERLKKYDACEVIGYSENKGKGAALKYGFKHIIKTRKSRSIIVTADCDGQHTQEDVMQVIQSSMTHPKELVLGTRNFFVASNGQQIPMRSRFGNTCSSAIFFFMFHRWLSDTQTGLRGIPSRFLSWMCEVNGERYEYEMQVLIACIKKNITFFEVPIKTVYEDNNSGSHFSPLRDSIKIMNVMLREFFLFIGASFFSSIVDIICAWTLLDMLRYLMSELDLIRITTATVCARFISMWVNYTMNKKFVFFQTGNKGNTVHRYIFLCLIVMLLSSVFVYLTSHFLGCNEKYSKVAVDCLLFFFSYQMQKGWVFRT